MTIAPTRSFAPTEPPLLGVAGTGVRVLGEADPRFVRLLVLFVDVVCGTREPVRAASSSVLLGRVVLADDGRVGIVDVTSNLAPPVRRRASASSMKRTWELSWMVMESWVLAQRWLT